MRDSDLEVFVCEFCGLETIWGGMEGVATIWQCEKCGKIFCDDCQRVNNEEDEKILCPDCSQK